MKKFIGIVVFVALLVIGIKAAVPYLGEEFTWLKEVPEWQSEGAYDIDTAGWFDNSEGVLSGSQEYTQLSSGQVNNLILRAAGCRVEMVASEEPDYYYAFDNMKKVRAYQEEDCIILNVIRDTELNDTDESSVLKLYVPKGVSLTSAELELGVGSMNIEKLQVQTLKVSVEAGKLTVGSLQTEELDATLGAGAVTLKNVDLQDAKLTVGAGSMNVEGLVSGDVAADCAMGNLKLDLIGTAQDFNYEVQCVAGNIQIGEEKYSGINEEKQINNGAEKNMQLDCAMGNMKLTFE